MTSTPALEKQQIVLSMVEPTNRGLTPSALAEFRHFTATSGGAVDTSAQTATIISTSLVGATADVYVGQIVQCVGPATSLNYLIYAEVRSFNPATDTLTVDELEEVAASGSQWKGYEPSDPYFAQTSIDANAIDDSRIGLGTDYFDDGDYAVERTGVVNPEGTVVAVTAFISASGTAAGAFPNNRSVGDLCHIRRFTDFVGPLVFEDDNTDLERDTQRGDTEKLTSLRGSRIWKLPKAPMYFRGSGSAAGDGVQAGKAQNAWRYLYALLTEVISTGELAVAGGSTSNLYITNGTLAQFPLGSVAFANGRLHYVHTRAAGSGAEDQIGVGPTAERALAAGEVVYGGRAYYPKLTGHQTFTFEEYDGALRHLRYGGMISGLEVTGIKSNAIPMLELSFEGGQCFSVRKSIPAALAWTGDETVPSAETDAYVTLGNTVRLLIEEGKFSAGIKVTRIPIANAPDGHYGVYVVDYDPYIDLTCILDESGPTDTVKELRRYEAVQTFPLVTQWDHRPGFAGAIAGHNWQWTNPKRVSANGYKKINFRAKPRKTGITGLPPWALCTT